MPRAKVVGRFVWFLYAEKTDFHEETRRSFDNSKNPVACFEGLESIFRERLEPRINADDHG
jgi:hypothetical protein